jgi:hypothetical protein
MGNRLARRHLLRRHRIAEVLKLFMDIEHNTRMHMSMHSTPMPEPVAASAGPNGPSGSHVNRMRELDEETAEGALLRGH